MAAMDPRDRTSETELRHATILFADVTNFTPITEALGAERAYGIFQKVLLLLDEIAREHGGSVDKYLGDAIMATYGVPLTVEEGPRAAVNAAIEMRNAIARFNAEGGSPMPIGIHSGINSGLVISGDVSGPVLREFSIMGDPVNVAFRLKDNAPEGEIWVGPDTYRYSCDAIEFRTLEPIAVKGKRERIPIYEVSSRHPVRYKVRGTEARADDFVGRRVELARIEAAITALRQGPGSVLSVVGDPGMGKSRLIVEARAATEREAGFLVGRCLADLQNRGFHPFADMLRSWANVGEQQDEESGFASLRDALRGLLGGEADEVLPYITRLAGLMPDADVDADLAGVQGDALDRVVVRSFGRLLESLCKERPLVVVLEDLHWADASSRRLLQRVLPLSARLPILFLLVSRSDSRVAVDLVGAAPAEVQERSASIRLAPLPRGESDELLVHRLGRADISGTTRAKILERAAGNPFYIEEVVRDLLDAHASSGAGGEPVIDAESIPMSIREVITSRVERLAERPRKLIQSMSVVGRRCPAFLADALAEGGASLEQDVSELDRMGLVVPTPTGLVFKHALTQEVTYASLLLERREALHLRLAELIRDRFLDDLAGANAMVAYHFTLADEAERAEEFLFAAGDEAVRSAASDEALHFLSEASRAHARGEGASVDPEKQLRLEKNVALAHHIRGDMIEAGQHLSAALSLMGEPAPEGRFSQPLRFARTLASVVGDLYLPGRVERRALANDRAREVIALMTLRSEAKVLADPERFVFDVMETHRVLGRVHPKSVEGAGGLLAGLVGIFSWGGISFSLGARALSLAERYARPDDPVEQLMLRFMRYVHHLARGDWSDEHAIDLDLVEQGPRHGRLWHATNYLGLRAEQHVFRGDFEDAEALIGRLDEIVEDDAYDLAKAQAGYLRAFLLYQRGDLTAARDAIDHYYTGQREDAFRIGALAKRAKLALLLGDRDQAQASLDTAGGIVERVRMRVPYYLAMYERSRFLLDVYDLEGAAGAGDPRKLRLAAAKASGTAKRALRVAEKMASRRPEVQRIEGTRLWLLGRNDRADHWWALSLEEAGRLGMRPDFEHTRAERDARRDG